MRNTVPIVLSTVLATSILGTPAVSTAQTQDAKAEAAQSDSEQTNLSNCWISFSNSLNYGNQYIEGKGPKSSDFEVHKSVSGEKVDSKLYSLVFFTYTDQGERKETSKVPTAAGEYYVYAKANKDSGATGITSYYGFRILEKNNLEGMSLQVTNSSVAYTGKPIALDATLVDYDGNEVDKSCYTLCYSDKHLNKLDGVPVECGEYYVNARAIAGSGYVGQANSYYRVNIVDTTDISYFNFYINQNVVVGGTEPTFNSSLYFLNENGESVSIDLKQGTDYTVLGYCSDAESTAYQPEPPTEPGDYYAVLQGVGSYKGTKKVRFSVKAANDMALCHFNFNGGFKVGDKLSSANFPVYNSDGSRLDPAEYRLVFTQNGEEIPGFPSEAGWYNVKAVAVEGSRKIGETTEYGFQIADPLDLSFLYSSGSNNLIVGYEPSFTITYRGETFYEQNQDFVIDHYESQSGVNLGKNCPNEAGFYNAIIVPAKGSKLHGTQSLSFTLRDPLSLEGTYADYSNFYQGVILTGTKPPLKLTGITGEVFNNPDDYTLTYYKNGRECDSISEPGNYQCVASATEGSGLYGKSESRNFDAIDPADISNYHFFSNPIIGDENSIDLRVSYIDSNDTPQQMSLGSSSEYEIVKVIDKNGKDVGTSIPSEPGEYTFTLKGKGNHYGTHTEQVTVYAKNDLALCSMKFLDPGVHVNMEPLYLPIGKRPEIKVVNKQGNELIEGKDYAIEYAKEDSKLTWDDYLNNDKYWSTELPKTEGTYYSRLKAPKSSSYCGVTGNVFPIVFMGQNNIRQMNISFDSKVTSEVDEWGQTYYRIPYTGSNVDTGLVIKNGSTELKENQDYTVKMNNQKNPGSAYLQIEGKGNYTGSRGYMMYICADLSDPNLNIEDVDPQPYDGIKKRPLPKLKLNGYALLPGDAYSVSYDNNVEPGQATITFTGNGLYAGCTGTATKQFTISPLSIEGAKVTVASGSAYNGSEQKPKLKVSIDNAELEENKDYTVSYKNNIDAGKATAVVTGAGRYSGSIETTFEIATADISKASVLIPSQSYTGSELKPDANVTLNSKTLKAGKDYTASYSDNVKIGTATVTIKGKGNYSGTATGKFEIRKEVLDISKASVNKIDDVTFTGEPIEPALKVSYKDKALKQGTDYEVSYSDNVNAGKAAFTLYGKGNYTGTLSANFKIAPANISDATVELDSSSYTYDGTAHEPKATVTLNGKSLSSETEYELTYADNTNAGNATATVTGKGNYSGRVTATYSIALADISSAQVTIPEQAYTGSPLTPVPSVKIGDKELSPDVDFTVSYVNNINTGEGYATVEGCGNYTGTALGTFQIVKKAEPGINRVSGNTRYDTMASLCQKGNWGQGGTVVLAYGANYPDALAAAALAGDADAPILLTDSSQLTEQAKAEITRLAPSKVVAVGGPNAISESVLSSAKNAAPNAEIKRIWGQTRYETSLNIMGELCGRSNTVIVATGTNFADALSISPYSYATGSPVILCDPSTGLSEDALTKIRNGGYTNAVIVGGKNAVSTSVENQLKQNGVATIKRLAGETRFETSQLIADFELSQQLGFGVDGIALATGLNFPDALAAGPVAGRKLTPLLLVDSGASSASQWLSAHANDISGALIVGGENAVTPADAQTLKKAMGI